MADEKAIENGFHEKVLRFEAQEIAKEVAFAVKRVEVSNSLDNSDDLVYLNIQTKENVSYCVELSVRGFQIVGSEFDTTGEESGKYFETIYSLLDSVSPEYRKTFGDVLMDKLALLQHEREVAE